jgi:glutamate-1-semialdehyde 2,1-aminomutase
MGKIIGGGFPIGSVGGRRDIIEQANPTIPDRIWIGGGTFSGYPLSMIAGLEMLEILNTSSHEYQRVNKLGENLISNLNRFFEEEQLAYIATGHKSLITLHSLSEKLEKYDPAEIVHYSDKKKEAWTQLSLLNRQITGMHGVGALSFAHTEQQLQYLQKTIEEITPKISLEMKE